MNNDQLSETRLLVRQIIGDFAEDDQLEDDLCREVDRLKEVGLSADEALLVASRRLESRDDRITVTSDRLSRHWRQIPSGDIEVGRTRPESRKEAMVIVGLAFASAIAVKTPELFGYDLSDANAGFYARNLSFFVLPFLVGYFAWKRSLGNRSLIWIASSFAAAMIAANAYPFTAEGATESLTAIHLPIALWLTVGIAYLGGRWMTSSSRMDFVRFSGEMFIHFVLIALGGAVLSGVTVFLFEAVGLEVEMFLGRWLLPCGAAGTVIVAAGLTESGALTKMAPLLTKLFTPLFAIVMIVFLVTIVVTGRGLAVDRNILVGFDLLLVLTLCLMLYGFSARNQESPPAAFDLLQLILVVSALLVDLFALGAIGSRISEFGFSANKTAAAGLNLLLLVNLTWTAWLYLEFLRGRAPFSKVECWQTSYLTVFVIWAALVAVLFPLLFGFG